MAQLLHLSDLHLQSKPSRDTIGDPKDAAIPASMQQTARRRIISTLEAIARQIEAGELSIDCIVVSGDIADKNDPTAYALLPEVLAPLVPARVPADRVVVVPGNHDVKKGSEPSSLERWEHFVTLRSHGYLTPLLEGIDIDDHGRPLGTAHSPTLVAHDASFLIVALNSANHCQVQLPVEERLRPHIDGLAELRSQHPAVDDLWDAWYQRGSVDVAWIGDGQQKAAAAALAEVVRAASGALRIAVLHHQLFPTGTIAEIKSFETMANLGEVLDWLADNQVDVALHGHKHAGRVFPYEHTAFHHTDTAVGYRTLVVSAPTARAGYDGGPIARLVSVDPPRPRASGVVLRDIPPIESGGSLDLDRRPLERFRLDAALEHGQVIGQSANDVHQKLLALGGDYSSLEVPLVCRVNDGASASLIPTDYPDVPDGVPEPQLWFAQTVAWWQNQRASRAADFNHGERLLAFGAGTTSFGKDGLNQISRAVHALERKQSSSRAIAVLVDPDTDLANDETEFPAFVLVQFAIESDRLNVTGYFRKQEMPHWWPINIAELGHLQNEVIARISGRVLRPGSITTITNQPVSGGGVPRVAIPALDGRTDVANGMLDLVLPLFHQTAAAKMETLAAWRLAFDDWAPSATAAADGDPMPVAGLRELTAALRQAATLYDSEVVSDLIDQMKLITAACDTYASGSANDSSRTGARAVWVADVTQLRMRILDLIQQRLDALTSDVGDGVVS